MTYVAVSANQRTHHIMYYLWRQSLWECMRGRVMKTAPRYLLVNLYQTIPKVWLSKMVVWQSFKLGSLFMYPVPTCCTRITNIFKHGRYSYRSDAYLQRGRFDLLLENSWYWV